MMLLSSEDIRRDALLLIRNGLTPKTASDELESAHLSIFFSDSVAESLAGQAALLTIANTASRCFRGGVFFHGPDCNVRVRLDSDATHTLYSAITQLGGRLSTTTLTGNAIGIGTQIPSDYQPQVYVRLDGSKCGLSSDPVGFDPEGFVISSVFASSIAILRQFVNRFTNGLAAAQEVNVDLFPSTAHRFGEKAVDELSRQMPDNLWILGLGHLGQALLWNLAMGGWVAGRSFRVQDFDRASIANLSTSVLSSRKNVGALKVDICGDFLEAAGAKLVDRRNFKLNGDEAEPPTAFSTVLSGLDSLSSRMAISATRASLIIDSAIGAAETTYSQYAVRSFRNPEDAESTFRRLSSVESHRRTPMSEQLTRQLRTLVTDTCGLQVLSGIAVGVPFVGTAVGALAVTQLLQNCRQLQGGPQLTSGDLIAKNPILTQTLFVA